jgi:exosortase/archaeosortase family protein
MEFSVDQACSGIYSLVAFAMFAAFLVLIVRGPITRKIALIPIGFLMLPLLNIIRISLIVSIAYGFGEPIAMTIFHTYSGWLVLSIGMLLLLLIAEKLLHLKIYENQSKAASCNTCNDSSKNNEVFCPNCGKFLENHQTRLDKKFWIKISALLLVTSVVAMSLQAPVFAFAQGLTLTNTAPEASTEVFPKVSDYNLNFLYRDTSFERISRTDASLTYAYFPQNVSNPTIFVLVGVGSSISNLHSWEVCLVSWRTAQGMAPVVNVFDSRDVQIMENPPIIARYFVFQYPPDEATLANYTQVTLYWYQKALFQTGLTVESKYTRISLLILTRNSDEYPKHEQRLLDLSQLIAAYWEPLKAQSLLSLGIPTIQILLVSTIVFAIAMQTTQYANEQRKKTTNLRLFERYGSPEEKGLYQTIKDLRQKTKETTTKNLESAIRKEPANPGKTSNLLDTLRNLQENGIIQLDVTNVQDQPKLVWKP